MLKNIPWSRSMLLALVGLGLMAYFITHQKLGYPQQPPQRPPAPRPFEQTVAGVGIVEPVNEAIQVAPQFSGLVRAVYVKEGQTVKAGDPLFKLDTETLHAQYDSLQAQVEATQSHETGLNIRIERLQHEPRPETLPPLQANVEALQSLYQRENHTLQRLMAVEDKRSLAPNEIERQQLTVAEAKARLKQAQAQLTQAKAGAWSYDIAEAKQGLVEAQQQTKQLSTRLKELQTQLNQAIVTAPIAGTVLQVNVKVGETLQLMMMTKNSEPPILLGKTQALQVRVDVDEVLASDVTPNMPATAFIKGNSKLSFPLTFQRIEPFMIPKKSLTGATAERNDVRVLQLVYTFAPPKQFAVWPGQQVDVYLKKINASNVPLANTTEADVDVPQ
ncbi:MAG: HlyD family secretion protein [Vampirovibrionales bacterium]